MENVDGSLRCKYYQYFYDMNKVGRFCPQKAEKQDGIQIIKQESGETGGRKRGSGRDSKKAIELTSVDFGVIYGVRSLAEQEKLFKSGRSQTMKSKHLIQKMVKLMPSI